VLHVLPISHININCLYFLSADRILLSNYLSHILLVLTFCVDMTVVTPKDWDLIMIIQKWICVYNFNFM
jgi:hypothetical protein